VGACGACRLCSFHEKATREYADPGLWARKAIMNVARIGKFSSDRTIMQYAEEIWDLQRIL